MNDKDRARFGTSQRFGARVMLADFRSRFSSSPYHVYYSSTKRASKGKRVTYAARLEAFSKLGGQAVAHNKKAESPSRQGHGIQCARPELQVIAFAF